MNIIKLIYVLFEIKLLSPTGLFKICSAVYSCGINVMTLLHITATTYRNKLAIVDNHEKITYQQLLTQSENLSYILQERYRINSGQKVGVMCKNHVSLIKTIFAVSRLGADLYLLNPRMSTSQFNSKVERYQFDLLIYDNEHDPLIENSDYRNKKIYSYHDRLPAVNNISSTNFKGKIKLPRASMGKLMLLTGGTTGVSKEAPHKPSFFDYINPFIGLLTKLNLLRYENIYIATPIYHGYGVANLFLFLALGKKIVISQGFLAKEACSLVRKHQVEVITVVPLMIQRMVQENVDDLKSLACIASGGAELNPKLASEVGQKLGNILYNLYGTSETGLNVIATPKDLYNSPKTIGRKIHGVNVKIFDKLLKEVEAGTIGQLYVKNKWSWSKGREVWIPTGDLGFRDQKGYYFLCGRVDDMIVSGGENVYPIELEQILIAHPKIADVAVIGISDEEFGQRLRAFVQLTKHGAVSEEELYTWLRSRVSKSQIPKEIVFIMDIPYTPLGKMDKKRLRE